MLHIEDISSVLSSFLFFSINLSRINPNKVSRYKANRRIRCKYVAIQIPTSDNVLVIKAGMFPYRLIRIVDHVRLFSISLPNKVKRSGFFSARSRGERETSRERRICRKRQLWGRKEREGEREKRGGEGFSKMGE